MENLTIRVLVTNVSHLYETETVGDLTVEKTIMAYVAYKEEIGQLVPEVKIKMNNGHSYCQWCSIKVLTITAIVLLFLLIILLIAIAVLHTSH